MTGLNRREFIQVSAASLLLNKLRADGATATPARISESGKTVRAEGANYVWEWSQETDRFRIMDTQGRELASSALQPIVVVQPVGQKGVRRFVAGRVAGHEIQGNRVTWTYEGVNNSAKLTVAWRFDEHGPWMEPVIYQTTAAEDVVSLHCFAEADGDHVKPSLESSNLVLPGISESPAISPLANRTMGWNLTSWLGRGAPKGASLEQQWGLPAHSSAVIAVAGLRAARGFPPAILLGLFAAGSRTFPTEISS
jgi:hypothetical protein